MGVVSKLCGAKFWLHLVVGKGPRCGDFQDFWPLQGFPAMNCFSWILPRVGSSDVRMLAPTSFLHLWDFFLAVLYPASNLSPKLSFGLPGTLRDSVLPTWLCGHPLPWPYVVLIVLANLATWRQQQLADLNTLGTAWATHWRLPPLPCLSQIQWFLQLFMTLWSINFAFFS